MIQAQALKDELVAFVRAELADVLQGTATDLKAYAPAIADDLIRLAAKGDEAGLRELAGQGKALGVLQGMRASKAGWETVRQVVGLAGRFALLALTAASKGVA